LPKFTRLRVQADPEDGLAEEIHHFKDGGGELEQVLPFTIEKQPAEGAGVVTDLESIR
jgi:hypothetical protein